MPERDPKTRIQTAIRVGLRMLNDPKFPDEKKVDVRETVEKARAALEGARWNEHRFRVRRQREPPKVE